MAEPLPVTETIARAQELWRQATNRGAGRTSLPKAGRLLTDWRLWWRCIAVGVVATAGKRTLAARARSPSMCCSIENRSEPVAHCSRSPDLSRCSRARGHEPHVVADVGWPRSGSRQPIRFNCNAGYGPSRFRCEQQTCSCSDEVNSSGVEDHLGAVEAGGRW
jgi:hypothetical protein